MDEPINELAMNNEASPELDQFRLQRLVQTIKEEQSLLNGIIAGSVASLLGATIWAIITAVTNYQIGWMAVGVGFIVGFAVRQFGKGIDKSFGVIGAILALMGCLAGNLFSISFILSKQESIPFFDLISRLNPSIVIDLLKVTFNPMDLLFYGIAIYEGYKLSFYQIPDEEIAKLQMND